MGDSIPISERCMRIALLLEKADAVIESAVALTKRYTMARLSVILVMVSGQTGMDIELTV